MRLLRPHLSRERTGEPTISVVIPVYQERAAIDATLDAVRAHGPDEVVVVDGGSPDGTLEAAAAHVGRFESDGIALRVVRSPAGRAAQMNAGVEAASSEVIVFLHVDTIMPTGALDDVRRCWQGGADGGWFALSLDADHWLSRATTWFATRRARLFRVATGDMVIFVRRAVFWRLGGYRPRPLMEDIEFSRRLARRHRVVCVTREVVTSARRWDQRGWWPTILLMWSLRAAYYFGASEETLAAWYPVVR